jgi:hypothetical protein
MTLIRLSDIRENDVHESAGMSNIPWELEYGFQKSTDPLDHQGDILEGMYWYDSSDMDESVLDGLSPDAPTYRGNEIVQSGTFITRITVSRGGREVCVNVRREFLIQKANEILRAAAQDIAIAIQREYIHPGPHVETVYEFCPASPPVSALVIGDDVFPLRQLLDLRGFPVIGKMEWSELDEC